MFYIVKGIKSFTIFFYGGAIMKKTRMIGFLVAIGLVFTQFGHTQTVYATSNEVSTTPIETIEQMSEEEALQNRVDNMVPSVSIEQATELVEGKMNDVVYLLQSIGKPLAQIAVVVSMIIALFGVFGDSSLISRGLIGIVIAGLVLFLISYAPEILDFVSGWMAEGTEDIIGGQSPF